VPRLSRNGRAVLDALLPADANPLLRTGLTSTGIEDFLDEFARVSPAHLRRAFRIGLFAGAWIAPLLVRRVPPITRLEEADRELALAAMAESGVPELRQLISVLKTVICLHYGGLSSVREAIGYP